MTKPQMLPRQYKKSRFLNKLENKLNSNTLNLKIYKQKSRQINKNQL